MKISQKGDVAAYINDMIAVLQNHQDCCVKPNGDKTFVIIPKLNVIAQKNISGALLWELFSEYRYQKNYIKKLFAYIYMLIMILIVKLNLPVLKNTKFNFEDQYPVILGGNNRIRLISACNKYALIHAINDATKWSCDAVIEASKYYSDCGSITLPKVMSLPCGGYLEEQIKGIALNRLTGRESEKINMKFEQNLNDFFDFQRREGFRVSIDEFFEYKHDYLSERMTNENLVSTEEIKFVLSQKDKIKRIIQTNLIECVWTHGDLNIGNIIFSEDRKMYIIDWEYFGVRHQSYDRFVYSKNLRHTQIPVEYNAIMNSVEVSVLDVLEEYIFSLVNGKGNIELDETKLNNCRKALKTRLGE